MSEIKVKKNILILGGYSLKNISWIKEMKEQYSNDYNVETIEYSHWYNNEEMNLEQEINKISNIIDNQNIDIIIAKSIGIYLTTQAIKNKVTLPKNIIFMGYPLRVFEEEKIDILKDLFNIANKTNTLIIQQENDPQGTVGEIKEVLNNNIKMIIIDGNDHAYNDIEIIKQHIAKFLDTK